MVTPSVLLESALQTVGPVLLTELPALGPARLLEVPVRSTEVPALPVKLEGVFLMLAPSETSVLFCKFVERSRDLSERLNVSAVITG